MRPEYHILTVLIPSLQALLPMSGRLLRRSSRLILISSPQQHSVDFPNICHGGRERDFGSAPSMLSPIYNILVHSATGVYYTQDYLCALNRPQARTSTARTVPSLSSSLSSPYFSAIRGYSRPFQIDPTRPMQRLPDSDMVLVHDDDLRCIGSAVRLFVYQCHCSFHVCSPCSPTQSWFASETPGP